MGKKSTTIKPEGNGLPKTMVVITKKLNVRKEPNVSGKIVGLLSQGDNVNLEVVFNEWGYVTLGDISGYAMLEFMKEK